MKFVLLSRVVVPRAPSGRFMIAPMAPIVSASDIAAPPCSPAIGLHRSGRTGMRASIRSFSADTSSRPISPAKGMRETDGVADGVPGALDLVVLGMGGGYLVVFDRSVLGGVVADGRDMAFE